MVSQNNLCVPSHRYVQSYVKVNTGLLANAAVERFGGFMFILIYIQDLGLVECIF